MILSADEQLAVTRVLREAGFTAAWILDSDDQTEVVFLVPKREGDFSSLAESESVSEVVESLMAILPGKKVWVGPNGEGLPKSSLY
jgi:hypothetical protein